jgi:hypothetical protein
LDDPHKKAGRVKGGGGQNEKEMYHMMIILDSNIWIESNGLNSSLASAIKFFIAKTGARIALPEVIRLETEKHLRSRIIESINKINDNYNILLSTFGKLKEVILPNNEEINNLISSVFISPGINIVEIPFSMESAKNSYLRTIESKPPSNEHDQQFKDGVIWEECKNLLNNSDVTLVTKDKGFYQAKDYSQGLAISLNDEIKTINHEFKILESLDKLLSRIKVDVDIPNEILLKEILEFNEGQVQKFGENNGFSIGLPESYSVSFFSTIKPDNLYIEFNVSFNCSDMTSQKRSNALLLIKGFGNYDLSNNSFSELKFNEFRIHFIQDDGSPAQVNNYFLHVQSGVMGHRDVNNEVKFQLN